MKSKSNKPMVNGKKEEKNSSEDNKSNIPQQGSKEKKVINKSNPWNIDPFMPHFTKPSINLITQNEEANQMVNQNKSSNTHPNKMSPPTG